MALNFLAPVKITDSTFVSSNAPETDHAAWNSGTTYALGNRCISTTTHRIYESVQGSNINHNPTTDLTSTWWLDVGPTNRWSMFDQSVGSVTRLATPLTVSVAPGIISSLALLDLEATSVTVTMLDAPGGAQVYSRTEDMADVAPLLDWYMYFFDAIQPRTSLIVDDLPPYATGVITVSIAAATTAGCGTLAIGELVELGQVLAGAGLGIIDYSRKETDDYGITSVVQRSYAKRVEAQVMVDNNRLDYIAKRLAAVRAIPVVWIFSNSLDALAIYGWVKDWSANITYAQISDMSLTVEGLV